MKPLIDRITQGPVTMHPQFLTVIDQQKAHVADCDGTHEIDDKTRRANAEFIAEAFTVAHETGMTPRQMAEKLANARSAFQKLLDTVNGFGLTDRHVPVQVDLTCLGSVLAIETRPNPEPVLPPGLSPLPPGTRYGGQLKDYEGPVRGHIWYPERKNGWTKVPAALHGLADYKIEHDQLYWHLAIPLDA